MPESFFSNAGIYQWLAIDKYATTPKYMQLINAVIKGIEENKLQKNSPLPSINEISFELDISRDTCVRAYRELKNMGIINSVAGKGYFISNANIQKRLKICLLFNKLSTHKKIIYDSFSGALIASTSIDFYIYNNDFPVFKDLLSSKKDQYDHYVIIPHFLEGGEYAEELINTLPKEKIILLDKLLPNIKGEFGAVYEDFEKDIYNALVQALEQLKKYPTLKIIFPPYTYHPQEILSGFFSFCQQYAFNYEVINDIKKETINEGVAYISLMEDDLVLLIEKILNEDLLIGHQVGVISYNETPLKRVILNGITTISTDFQMMGEKAAQLILNGSKEKIAIPFSLTIRNSL